MDHFLSNDKDSYAPFSLPGGKKKNLSPLNRPVWKFCLLVSAGCFLAWIVLLAFGFNQIVSVWAIAVILLLSWVLTVRMLFLDAKFKIFWIIWLSSGFLLQLRLGGVRGIWVVSASFSLIFLFFRRYRPYGHLSSRRKAIMFLFSLVMVLVLTAGFIPGEMKSVSISLTDAGVSVRPETSQALLYAKNLARYALGSLRIFWLFSIFRFFLIMRLHFLKLKPKLAVSVLMIAGVPLVLATVMGLITLYSTLGESRAIRAGNILQDWAELAAKDQGFIHAVTDRSFSYEEQRGRVNTSGDTPEWLKAFIAAVKTRGRDSLPWKASEEGAYFKLDSDLWLGALDWRDGDRISFRAGHIDSYFLNRLAKMLHCNIRLLHSHKLFADLDEDTAQPPLPAREQPEVGSIRGREIRSIRGRFLPIEQDQASLKKPETSFWKRPLFFGITHVDMVSFASDKFGSYEVLLLVESGISDIFGELSSEKNPLSLVVLAALLVLAATLLTLEIFALFFGVRITTGITSAVKKLHQGTCRISEGDFDINIDIPNEDELGDLAVSFNEMAAAVKRGQEQAVARERLESELKTARRIQEKLLPHEMPDIPGFEIVGTSLPSEQVGGDYFDFLDMGEEKVGIAVADVSGKGIPAALLMSNLQASLHAQALQEERVSVLVSKMNDLLALSTDSNMFATFFYGVLNRRKSSFTSTNAGHNPPLLFRTDGKIEKLEAGGLLIGFLTKQKYAQKEILFEPGDVLVLYTDGITEAVSEKGAQDLFGEKRLIEVIQANRMKSAREIQAAILKAIASHTGNSPQSDDITLVVIKRK